MKIVLLFATLLWYYLFACSMVETGSARQVVDGGSQIQRTLGRLVWLLYVLVFLPAYAIVLWEKLWEGC